jgi:ArsR family transcriptional regulator, arsenate/arsenite/antimonite-responsive transcriptional repressor
MRAIDLPVRVKGVCCPPAITLPAERVDSTVDVLGALAHPTRLQMIGILRQASGPVCICDFTAVFDLSQPTISHHMGRLREAGLVEVSRKGIWSYYRLSPQLDPRTRALLDLVA